jgi:hypothetical protein
MAALPKLTVTDGLPGHPVALLSLAGTRRAIRFATRVPGPVVALVTLSLLAWLAKLPVETIGDRFGSIPQALPAFASPKFNWPEVQQLFVPTVTLALLGAVESLLCARVADGLSTLRRHDPNQELMAQGRRQRRHPVLRRHPGDRDDRPHRDQPAAPERPARSPAWSTPSVLLAIVLVAAPLAAGVPLAVLAGVLLFVAWNMADWREFARLAAFSLENRVKLLAAFLLTVMVDPHGGDGGRPGRRLHRLRLPDEYRCSGSSASRRRRTASPTWWWRGSTGRSSSPRWPSSRRCRTSFRPARPPSSSTRTRWSRSTPPALTRSRTCTGPWRAAASGWW